MLGARDRRSVCRSNQGPPPRDGGRAVFAAGVDEGRAPAGPARAKMRLLVGAAIVVAAFAMVPAAATAAGHARAKGATRVKPRQASDCPWVGSTQPIAQRVAEVMSQMSVVDEDFLVEGHGTANEPPTPGGNPYVFWMPGLPTSLSPPHAPLCIPALGEEDGPAGVADGLPDVTQLPAGVDLAATFDQSAAQAYGQVIGSEERGKGAAVNLGPTINIDRDPRWGRSFEAFTEDPFLNAALATDEIDGVQSTGEMSQVKHFAAYNQETNRNTENDDVIASQRTLNEIYLPAFQAAVQQAKAGSVMCSYATVNGVYACQSKYLMTNKLDQMWDFPGFVTSDYGALHSTAGGAYGGLDQEQPFNTYFGQPLLDAVLGGAIPQPVLNTMVQRMLTEMFRFGLFDNPPTGNPYSPVTTPAHVATGETIAEEGTTLLKNDPGTLPIPKGNTVAVIGPAGDAQPIYGGGGSAYVIPSTTVTPYQGISALDGASNVTYTQGLPTDSSLTAIPAANLSPAFTPLGFGASYTGTLTAPETGTYVLALTNPCFCYSSEYLSLNGTQLIDNPSTPPVHVYSVAVNLTAGSTYSLSVSGGGEASALTWAKPSDLAPGIAAAVAAAQKASSAVVVVSDDTESEATDRPSLNLPSAQDELISAVTAANPHTTVVIDAGAPVVMPWLSQAGAVLDAWYPGQSNGTALANVLFGNVDPSGHLPVTFPASLSDVPASTTPQFPGINGQVLYTEGLDVGYRWYDAQGITPLFPFGYGLSYTRFRFSGLHVTPRRSDGVSNVTVSATITNAGKTTGGADVAQLYLGDPMSAGEPPRELVGFKRVFLPPGQSALLQFTIAPRDTWWWDQDAGGWTQTAGQYQVYVGDSSAMADLPLHGSFTVPVTAGARQVVVHAPRVIHPAQSATVRVRLTHGGTETLRSVIISLQLPQGWSQRAIGRTAFTRLAPQQSAEAEFQVTPPSWEPATNEVVHATAQLGLNAQREAGVTVGVH
jgi:beta-glucosidase